MAIVMLIVRQHHETPVVPGVHPDLAVRLPAPLLTIGGQTVSAIENASIKTLETPLAVAGVWVCFVEVATITSFVGGIIVMAAVAGHVCSRSVCSLAAE